MACTTLLEVEDDCLNNIGGVTQLLYVDQSDIDVEETVVNSDGVITAMESATPLKSIVVKKNASNYVESEKIDLEAGSNYIEATVSISLKHRNAAKSKAIRIAGEGQRKLALFIKDGNGRWWYLKDMQLSANEGGSGANKAEGSKYDLTFMGEYEKLAYEVQASVITGLLA